MGATAHVSPTQVLRRPGVMRLFVTSLVARFPMAALGVLFVLYTRAEGHSYAAGGVVAAASAIGTAIGSPLLGRMADTRGQTPVLVCSAIVCSGALATAAVTTPVPALVALAALAGLAQPPVAAAARAVWGRRLEEGALHAVLALEASLQELAFMLGPIVLVSVVADGTPARGLIGAAVIFLVATLAYALSPEPRAAKGRPSVDRPRGGALAVPGVRTLVILAVTLGASFGGIEVGIAAFAEQSGHTGATGLMLGFWALGSFAAGLYAARRGSHSDPVKTLLALHLMLTVCNALLIASPGLAGLAVLLVIAGVAIAPLFAVIYRLLSEVADADSVTEAFGWELTGITTGVAMGSALGGVLATGTGPRAAFAAAAAATCAGALIGRARQATLKIPQPPERAVR